VVDPLWFYAEPRPESATGAEQKEDGLMQLADRSPASRIAGCPSPLYCDRPGAPAARQAVASEILVGAAAVIDGDTFRIGETVVRLFDVDLWF
jgi:hypothetical protein